MSRNYKKEYEEYQGTPEQIHRRSLRNAARHKLEAQGEVHKGDGKDVGHIHGISHGNTNSNLEPETVKYNRGWRRGQHGYKPVG